MKLKDERLEVVRLMLGLGGYDAGQAYRATQALETIDAEIAALKAEVETLRKEVGSKSAWATQMQKDLQQERERVEKLAAEWKRVEVWINMDSLWRANPEHPLVKLQALLAAKRDEGEV